MGSHLLEWMRRPGAVILYDFAESAVIALEQRFGNNIEAIPGGMHNEIERRGPDRAVFRQFLQTCFDRSHATVVRRDPSTTPRASV
jgi:hypothetical protein